MIVVEWKKNLAVMWLAQFIGMGAITGVVSFLPLYIPQLGVTSLEQVELWSGVLMGVASFCAAIAGPFWGSIADRSGRKPMVERVMLVFGVVMISMAFVQDVYQLFALRTIQGIFGGFTAAAMALVTSITPEEKINYTLGIFQTAMIAGGAFGPLFGGIIADHFGYRQTFFAFGLLCLLSLIIIHFAVTEHFQPVIQTKKTSIFMEISHLIAIPGLKSMLIVQFLIQFALQIIAPVLPLYIQTMASDSNYIASACGAIIAAAGLTSSIASASTGSLSNRFSHRFILIIAAFLSSLFFAAQAIVNNVWMLGLARGLSGFSLGIMIPVANAIITALIPQEKRGIAYGVTTGAMQFGNVIGPLSGGAIALLLGIPAVFWFTALFFVIVALWVVCYVKS